MTEKQSTFTIVSVSGAIHFEPDAAPTQFDAAGRHDLSFAVAYRPDAAVGDDEFVYPKKGERFVEMHAVQSSNILAVGWEFPLRTMWAVFKGGAVYTYEGLSVRDYYAFRFAPSCGRALKESVEPKSTKRTAVVKPPSKTGGKC